MSVDKNLQTTHHLCHDLIHFFWGSRMFDLIMCESELSSKRMCFHMLGRKNLGDQLSPVCTPAMDPQCTPG